MEVSKQSCSTPVELMCEGVHGGGRLEVDPLVVTVDGGNPAVVWLEGELDLAGLPRLTSALAGHDGDVELDCSRLEFIDAAGVGAFVREHLASGARGAKLTVVNPSRLVLRVLKLVDLDTVLNIRRDGEGP